LDVRAWQETGGEIRGSPRHMGLVRSTEGPVSRLIYVCSSIAEPRRRLSTGRC